MAYFECIIGSGSATAIPLIVTCTSSFAGTTITASKTGARTQTQTCPSSSPYEVTFILPEDGIWTISGIVSGQTFSETVTILPYEANLSDIPEGATVTPTDDIQIWLHCSNIWDKNYTTLSQVLADASTLQALIASTNAVDYMARSATWSTDVTADSSAMSYIGLNDYCSDALLSNSTWLNAICNSTHFDSVLTTKVPTMTSSTAPSGEVSASSTTNGSPYKVFDGRTGQSSGGSYWDTTNYSNAWIRYRFTSPVAVRKMYFNTWNGVTVQIEEPAHIQASNDGTNFINLKDFTTPGNGVNGINVNFVNNTKYQYYQVKFDQGNYQSTARHAFVDEMQYYGRT